MNLNNCNTCSHRLNPQGGFCYMFRNEEDIQNPCGSHSKRTLRIAVIGEGSHQWSGLLAAYKAAGAEIVFLDPDPVDELKGTKFTGVIIDEVITGELGTFENMRIIHDMQRAVIDNAAPKQHRIQHGPVRKGRGGKVRKW